MQLKARIRQSWDVFYKIQCSKKSELSDLNHIVNTYPLTKSRIQCMQLETTGTDTCETMKLLLCMLCKYGN